MLIFLRNKNDFHVYTCNKLIIISSYEQNTKTCVSDLRYKTSGAEVDNTTKIEIGTHDVQQPI